MKDKKDLRNSNKETHYLLFAAKIVAIITAVVFVVSLSKGTVNAAVNKSLTNQYQDKQLGVLNKDVNKNSLNFVGKLISVGKGILISDGNVKTYNSINKQLNNRADRQREVSALYDGKSFYKDEVSTDGLDQIDRDLLRETNQDVYQTQKNRLDTIRIWFEQTNDGVKYINKIWDKFNKDKNSLDIRNVSKLNTFNKLLKNKQAQKDVGPKIKTMNSYYQKNSKDDGKVARAKEELEALKKSPLTMKYKPVNVNIISKLDDASKTTDVLTTAGISDAHVLYYDKSKNNLTYLNREGNNYVPDGDSINVLSGSVSSGKYSVKAIIQSSGSGAVVTDHSSDAFGKYTANATVEDYDNMGITNSGNDVANFNSASPVFWVKNNTTIQNSIYFGNASTIGFIYAGGSSYTNGIQITKSDLNRLQSKSANGLLIYVK